MTICIAAIGKEAERESIVFATDHMVSLENEYETWKFEHSMTKYKELNKDTVAMIAGNPFIFDDLVRDIPESSYHEIKNKIQQNFIDLKESEIQAVLEKFQIKKEDLRDHVITGSNNPYLDKIVKMTTNYEIESEILLVGFDAEGRAMTTYIYDGKAIEHRDLNFHAIGSGKTQAVNTLMFQRHDKNDSILMTIYDVYKAKRNAEVSEGVGRNTDLVILRKDIGCKKLTKEDIKILDYIYEEELELGRTHNTLSNLRIE